MEEDQYNNLPDENKWIVVSFAKDETEDQESAEAVPNFWIKNGGKSIMWPPGSTGKVIKAISTRKVPDNTWKQHNLSKVYWDTGMLEKIFFSD